MDKKTFDDVLRMRLYKKMTKALEKKRKKLCPHSSYSAYIRDVFRRELGWK